MADGRTIGICLNNKFIFTSKRHRDHSKVTWKKQSIAAFSFWLTFSEKTDFIFGFLKIYCLIINKNVKFS